MFHRSIFSENELDLSFAAFDALNLDTQDVIEVGCLHQYLAVLKHHNRVHFPLDILKHHQGNGPDFTICNGHYFGVEMTKVTTQDYQVWLKSGLNYLPIKSMQEYMHCRAEQRVADLAIYRVKKKNYKIPLYFAAEPDMEYCDLVLEENGNCGLDSNILMTMLQKGLKKLRFQRYKTISLISGSKLYYAFNTSDAQILNAPEVIPRAKRHAELEETFNAVRPSPYPHVPWESHSRTQLSSSLSIFESA